MLLCPWSSVGTADGFWGAGIGGNGGRFKSGADESVAPADCDPVACASAPCEPAACASRLTIDEMSAKFGISLSRAGTGKAALPAADEP
jgi:hypothetical protein